MRVQEASRSHPPIARLLTATLLAGVTLAPLVSSAGQAPPSSLEAERSGKVLLSHVAKRITECTASSKDGKLVCSANRESVDPATSVMLEPVPDGSVSRKDRREARTLTLPKEGKANVTLGVGTWEVAWPGRVERDRFYVAEGDEFAIELRTEVGACKKVKNECRLKTDQTKLEVKIPARCRR
ncbi:MAG: hypothetical protein U0263_05695 [Polyangiaceae bacterium]